jgi:hypothetical protein
MKNQKVMATMFASMLLLVVCFTATDSIAQTKTKSTTMKDCCMMKDGKMMCMKDGKTMPMEKNMTMKNGTKCMTNGECIMKDGKKMQMKEGECMDMNGKMDHCDMMMKDSKSGGGMKTGKKDMSATYTCPVHSEVTSDKPGKCPKCGMELGEKNKTTH